MQVNFYPTFGGRSSFFTSLYEGDYSRILIAYCNLYQNIVYLGAFWFCLTFSRQKRSSHGNALSSEHSNTVSGRTLIPDTPPSSESAVSGLPVFLGLISVFGGLLFHMIWEANARYIFLYGLTLLPYTARGLGLLADSLSNYK